MQLLAKLADPALLHRVCVAVDKMQHRACLVKLTRAALDIAVLPASGAADASTVVWATLDMRELCDHLVIESKNADTIGLELAVEHLTKAVKSVLQGQEVWLKLIKRNGDKMLAVFCKSQTSHGLQTTVEQVLPVRVLRADEVAAIRAPHAPEMQLNVVLPSTHSLWTVLDRMKTMSSRVAVMVTRQGELRLHVHSDAAEVMTQYRDLQVATATTATAEHGTASAALSSAGGASAPRPALDSIEARVDVKELHRALAMHVALPEYIVCSIPLGRTLMLYGALETGPDARTRNHISVYLAARAAGDDL